MKCRKNSIHRTLIAVLAGVYLLGALPAMVHAGRDESKAAYDKLQDLIYDERYQQANEASARFLKDYPESRYAEAAEFWHCYSLQRSTRDYQKSFDCYAKFLEKYPEGKWSDDARAEYAKLAKQLADAGDPRGKAALENLSKGEDEDLKLSVLWALMDDADDVSVDTVVSLLDSKDADVRRHVVFMISDSDDPRVMEALIRVARTDPDPDVRRHAIYALSGHAEEEPVMDAMVEIMRTEKDADIRRHVLYAISESRRDDVVDILVEVARSDADEDARRAAVFALSDVDSDAATEALKQVLESTDDVELQKAALFALIDRADVDILPTLEKLALRKPSSPAERDLNKAAVYALAEIDDPAVVPVLSEIVRSSDDVETRKAAFYALAEHGGDEAEATLRAAAVSGEDEELAKAAVWALIDVLDDDEASAFFMDVYRKSPFAEVRKAALYAAMSTGGEASAPALGEMLESAEDPEQRRTIVWALGEIDSDESVAILEKVARSDKNREVRKAAVQALGAIGSPKAKQALRALLDER